MSVVTVGEMLDRAQDFEARLEGFYADLRDRAERDGVRLLTYYLARHRRHLPEALAAYPEGELEHIRKVPLKLSNIHFEPATYFEGKSFPSDITANELLDTAIEFVEYLIHFYRWMADQPLGKEDCRLFLDLLHIEEKHVVELKKTKAMDYF